MSPDTLASILADTPYPGCVITRPGGAVRLDFDGLLLRYQRDGWHFGGTHLESTLSEHSAPEQVHPEIRRILKVVMVLKVERALNEAEADGTTDPVAYLTDLAAEKMLAILDVAALANVRQAKIASNVAEFAARDMRIADLERDLAAKDKSLTTAHAALKKICEVIGAPVPCAAEDAVEAVKTLLGAGRYSEERAVKAERILREIEQALDRYDIPKRYDDASHPCADGQLIAPADRVRLGMTILNDGLIGAVARLRNAEQFLSCRDDELLDANDALDAIGAPRGAGKRDRLLDIASRIRAAFSR